MVLSDGPIFTKQTKFPNQAWLATLVKWLSSSRLGFAIFRPFSRQGRLWHCVTTFSPRSYSIDFPAKYQNWDTTDPAELFDAPTVKNESNPKVRIVVT